jgi:hypothetical protein
MLTQRIARKGPSKKKMIGDYDHKGFHPPFSPIKSLFLINGKSHDETAAAIAIGTS